MKNKHLCLTMQYLTSYLILNTAWKVTGGDLTFLNLTQAVKVGMVEYKSSML